MANLMTYGGMLLVRDGQITTDENCCCGNEDCPNCCSRITSGALIDGEIKIFVTDGAYALEVTIITPQGNRIVCADDVISINMKFTGAVAPEAYITWDAAWVHAGHTPGIDGVTGFYNEYGAIYWGTLAVTEFDVTLKFFPCLLEATPSLGLIQIGSARGDSLGYSIGTDIELIHCDSLPCCDVTPNCVPCCWYLDGGVYDADNGVYLFYAETATFYIRVEVILTNMADKTICVEDGESPQVTVTVTIGSRDRLVLETHNFDVDIVIAGFGYVSCTPAADSEPVVGEPGTVAWNAGTLLIYEATVAARCPDRLPDSIQVTVYDNVNEIGIGTGASFIECSKSGGCSCCCPTYCCDECNFPVSASVCDEPAVSLGYEEGGPTQIENFKLIIDHDPHIFCRNTPDDDYDVEIAQTVLDQLYTSYHYTACTTICGEGGAVIKCGYSRCFFRVTVLVPNCDDLSSPFEQQYTLTYTGAGVWQVFPGYSVDGDCDGGSEVIPVTGGTVTITFDVTRDLPTPTPVCPPE